MMRFGWLAAAAAMVMAGQASAAVIEKRIAFSASDFGASAPVPLITGEFWFSFDNAVSSTSQPVQIRTISRSFSSPIVFDYLAGADQIDIGANGAANAFDLADDFVLSINDISKLTHPGFNIFVYQLRSQTGRIFSASNVVISDLSVPEPASWLMMLTGFAAIGWAMRRKEPRHVTAAPLSSPSLPPSPSSAAS